MSRYSEQPLSFESLKTVSLAERGGKVSVAHFAQPYSKGAGVGALLDSLPRVLAAGVLRDVINALKNARARKRASIPKTTMCAILRAMMSHQASVMRR